MSKSISQWSVGDMIEWRGPFGSLKYIPNQVSTKFYSLDAFSFNKRLIYLLFCPPPLIKLGKFIMKCQSCL